MLERTLRCLGPTSLFHRWRNYSLETTDPCYRDLLMAKPEFSSGFLGNHCITTVTLHHQPLYFMLCWVYESWCGYKKEEKVLTESSSEIEVHCVWVATQGWLQTLLFKISLRFTHCHSKVLRKFAVNISKETVNQLTDFIFCIKAKVVQHNLLSDK